MGRIAVRLSCAGCHSTLMVDDDDPGRMLVQAYSMIRPGGLCFLAVRLTSSLELRYSLQIS
jgi:hypothetical protein